MNQINTKLFLHESWHTPTNRSNPALQLLVNQSVQGQQPAPSTGKPMLRMQWVDVNQENIRASLQARWQMK